MKKILFVFGLLLLAGWAFRVLDYHFATRLKEPIYVTGLSGKRFIKFQRENVTHIAFEEVDGSLIRVHEALDGIDIASFQLVDTARMADGSGRVDVRYRDKNCRYTIHDGEEKYVVRHVPARRK